jgi:hypothetical protein
LCFTFYVLAACVYIQARQGGASLGWRSSTLFIALNVFALNSKEMAATLPVVLLAYELLYHVGSGGKRAPAESQRQPELAAPQNQPTAGDSERTRKTWVALPTISWVLWISFAMTVAATKIRTGPGTPFAGVPEYAMHVSVHQLFLTTRQLLADLFVLTPGSISTTNAVLVFATIWAIAIWAFRMDVRRRDLMLCAAIITVTPLPINFIHARGFFVMYLPLIGWAMFIAIAAVAWRDWLLEHVWHRPALPSGTWEPERVGLFLVTLYVLFTVHSRDVERSFLYPDERMTRIHSLNASLERMNLPIPRGGSVLFVSDASETMTGTWRCMWCGCFITTRT